MRTNKTTFTVLIPLTLLTVLTGCPADDGGTGDEVEMDTTDTTSSTDTTDTTSSTDTTDTTDTDTSTNMDTDNEPICGNGITEADEQCDDGGTTSECNVNCTVSTCGDGILNTFAGEECDDANIFSDDGCSPNCKDETCGDGIWQADETCDLGLANSDYNWLGCENSCSTNCDGPSACCGDGHHDSEEFCDWGEQNSDDYGSICNTTCSASGPYCGDGIIQQENELCDPALNPGCNPNTCTEFHSCEELASSPGITCSSCLGCGSASCATLWTTCEGSVVCIGYVTCLAQGSSLFECEAQNPGGEAESAGILQCMLNSCSEFCGSSLP